jgi:hypothetical protein
MVKMRTYFFAVLVLLLLISPVFAAAPVTNFTSNITTGMVPMGVQFNDTTPIDITNKLTLNQANGGENGATTDFWENVGTEILTANTTTSWQGTHSIKIITPNLVTSEGFQTGNVIYGLSPNVNYTASLYIRGESGGETVKFLLVEFTSIGGTVGTTTQNCPTLTTDWQRVNVTRHFGGTGNGIRIKIITQTTQAATFFIDGLQVEAADSPTSWTIPLNAPTAWLWQFDDGGSSTAQNPIYTYNVSGIFDVSLEATNVDGSDTETKVAYINVGAVPTSFNTSYVSCQNRTGNLSLYSQSSGPDWMEYYWNASANVTRMSIDSRLIPDFDNASTSILISDLTQGQNHTAKIYNATDYGQLICYLNAPAVQWTPDINPSVEGSTDLSWMLWVGAALVVIFILFGR